MSGRFGFTQSFLLLLLLSAGVYLLGNEAVALWDRDEPRYAQASRQMLFSGDWVVPRYLDTVRSAKPILIYWLQASSMAVFGDNAFAARFPSVVAMLLVLAVLAVALRKVAGPRRALWTCFILASSALFMATAKMALTDGVLLLWILLAQIGLYALLQGQGSWPMVVAMALAIGLAGLTKGPVVLGVLGTTLLSWWAIGRFSPAPRRTAEHTSSSSGQWVLKGLVGVILVLAVAGPWVWLIEQRLPGYFWNTLNQEVIDRARNPQEGHQGPPGYYLLTLGGTFFPWSFILPAAVVMAWRNQRIPLLRFALAATLGPWVMFEIVQTKLPHYLLPIYPALAFMTADLLLRSARGRTPWLRDRTAVLFAGIWGLIVMVLGWTPLGLAIYFQEKGIPRLGAVLIGLAACCYALLVFLAFRRRNPLRAALYMGGGMALVVALFHALYLPHACFLRISPHLADALVRQGATPPGQVVMIDYKEPSLAFYQGGTIREADDDLFLRIPMDQWPTWVVIPKPTWNMQPSEVISHYRVTGSIRGVAYADRARPLDVLVLRRRE